MSVSSFEASRQNELDRGFGGDGERSDSSFVRAHRRRRERRQSCRVGDTASMVGLRYVYLMAVCVTGWRQAMSVSGGFQRWTLIIILIGAIGRARLAVMLFKGWRHGLFARLMAVIRILLVSAFMMSLRCLMRLAGALQTDCLAKSHPLHDAARHAQACRNKIIS